MQAMSTLCLVRYSINSCQVALVKPPAFHERKVQRGPRGLPPSRGIGSGAVAKAAEVVGAAAVLWACGPCTSYSLRWPVCEALA